MELINLIAKQQKEDAETLLLKANISLYAQGQRWKCLEYLVKSVRYDKLRSVEHAGYLLSKLMETQILKRDTQDVDYGGVDVLTILK